MSSSNQKLIETLINNIPVWAFLVLIVRVLLKEIFFWSPSLLGVGRFQLYLDMRDIRMHALELMLNIGYNIRFYCRILR